jgi:molecular chaperone HscC
MIIGIDLGTTNSLVAYMTDLGPKLIPNALGEFLTPSVVGIDDSQQILVGRAAREMQVLEPDSCVGTFKRYMGTDHKLTVAGKTFTPEQLSSFVLKSLKADAEAHLGHIVERAVITVPAYFNDNQRKATMRAGQLAGLKVERIVNEPTAAAIAYGLHEAGQNKIIAVFDLGGGTFDVSLVELFEGTIEVRASSGECFLGGEDFTRTIAARLLERQGKNFEHAEMTSPLLVSRLLQLSERIKRQLTQQEQAELRMPDAQGNLLENSPTLTVSRSDLAQWTDTLLSRVELPIRRCLGDAKLTRSDVNEILLVGGATRMPSVVNRVEQIFGKPPQKRLNPDEVVALGAAIQAGLINQDQGLDDFVVTDVSPFTLGISISKEFGNELRDGYFLPIINRNTTIPVSRVERVNTTRPNQTSVNVRIYQGESRRVEQNLLLGEFEVRGIPRGPAGQEVDIRFTYDLNGILEVEAVVVSTKVKSNLVITHHAKGLTGERLEQALAEMAALKHHPREDSANRFLLKRAERVYQELPKDARHILTQLLDGFEDSLDQQDAPDAIEAWRDKLMQFLDHFENGENPEEFPEEPLP